MVAVETIFLLIRFKNPLHMFLSPLPGICGDIRGNLGTVGDVRSVRGSWAVRGFRIHNTGGRHSEVEEIRNCGGLGNVGNKDSCEFGNQSR